MNQLFDKQIEIELYDTPGGTGTPTDKIVIPPTGVKPNIGLQANFIPSMVVGNVNVRITNFYPSKALSEYKWMKITAGYRDSQDKASMAGQVKVAYQESPSPDGVTLISLLTANISDCFNAMVSFTTKKGRNMSDALNEVLAQLSNQSGTKWTLSDSTTPYVLTAPYSFCGTAKDCLQDMKTRWSFEYMFEGTELVIYEKNQGRINQTPLEINYLSSPPQAAASGITFTAPWIPKLRPGMRVKIDPKYFRQSFGASQVSLKPIQICQTIQLEFNTVSAQNSMTVLCLNTDEVQ